MQEHLTCCIRANTLEWGHYKCPICGANLCYFHTALWNNGESRCAFCFSETACKKTPQKILVETNPKNQFDTNAIIVIDGLYMAGMQKHVLDQIDVLTSFGIGVTIITVDGGGRWADKFYDKACKVILDFDNQLNWDILGEIIPPPTIKFVIGHLAKPIKWIANHIPPSIPAYAHFHTDPSEFEIISGSDFEESCDRFDEILFPSLATLKLYSSLFLNGNFSKYQRKLRVLPNPLPKNYHPKKVENVLKNKDQLAIAIVSRLDPDKLSVELFWDTLAFLDELYPDFKIKIAGGGELFWELKNVIETSPYKDRIELLGFYENMSQLYNWADVLFLPSKREAMPYVLMESMSFRKPFVAPKVGIFNSIASGSPIYIFEPGDGKRAAELITLAFKEGFQNIDRLANHPGFISFDNWTQLLRDIYKLEGRIK